MEGYMMYVWLIVIVLAIALEATTAQLVSIWFVAGGLTGIVANALGASPLLQVLLAVVVTLLLIILTRPFVRKKMKSKSVGTNSDRYIGEHGVVLEQIDNSEAVGQVKVGTSLWSAKSKNENQIIPKDSTVKVLAIEGVKLVVEPVVASVSEEKKGS